MTRGSRILVLVLTILALAMIGFAGLKSYSTNELTVVNQSGVGLKALTVKLPWETIHFGPLEIGATETKPFTIRHDAHFEIRGQLTDGAPVVASDGYVTNGQYGQQVRIELGRGGSVKFTQGTGAT